MIPVRKGLYFIVYQESRAPKILLQVLPGFAGQVPDAFVERYPGASYTKQTWKPFKASNLSGVYMIRWIDVRLSFVVKPIAVPWIQSLSR